MNPVAAIDCGTNSIRLLIAEPRNQSAGTTPLRDLVREMRIVRLGENVDKTGNLSEQAIERTLLAVDEYQQMITELGATKIRFVGTSAMRDAHNGASFMDRVEEKLGVRPEVVAGTEEAALSFAGATTTLEPQPQTPSLLVDIGGGSTELVVGNGAVTAALSVDMGSVRVTERFGITPTGEDEIEKAATWISQQLEQASGTINYCQLRSVVGVAGTVTTLAAYALGVKEYSPQTTHGSFLTWDQWEDAISFMIYQPASVKAALPVMPRGREDVIGAGALIWRQLLRKVRHDTEANGEDLRGAYVSEHDVLDGIALSLLP